MCGGYDNAEVEEAIHGDDAYVEWIGCGGIGFARSTNGGKTFGNSLLLPGSANNCHFASTCSYSWDPSIVVSPGGAVYAGFMYQIANKSISPVVDASTNGGRSFTSSVLPVPDTGVFNWGDRDFLAIGPHNVLYVTWDYGPEYSEIQLVCPPGGSCSFSNGDLNEVIQHSTNGGRTWSAISHVSPGYPDGGADLGPILVQPSGTVDVLFDAMPTAPGTLALSPGSEYFTRSTNEGRTWSAPVMVGGSVGTVATSTWWIDGDLSTDAAGNLYATWDTQGADTDVGWLSYSTDGGRVWSAPIAVSSPTGDVEVLTESSGVARGIADVAWQTPTPSGYATFVRPYELHRGWLTTGALKVSRPYGAPHVWPGDTFGIAPLPDRRATAHGRPVLVTWGSDVPPSPDSEIWAAIASP